MGVRRVTERCAVPQRHFCPSKAETVRTVRVKAGGPIESIIINNEIRGVSLSPPPPATNAPSSVKSVVFAELQTHLINLYGDQKIVLVVIHRCVGFETVLVCF